MLFISVLLNGSNSIRYRCQDYSNLTADINLVLLQAFERVKATSGDLGGDLRIITKDHYDDALSITKNNFLADEPLGRSIGIEWTPDFESFFVKTFDYGMSVILLDRATGEPIGIRATRPMFKSEPISTDGITDEKMLTIFRFYLGAMKENNIYKRYDVEEGIHFMGLTVDKKYRRRGFGIKLMKVAVQLVEELNIRPIVIQSEGTSNYSKRIYEKIGFETIGEAKFEDFVEDGQVVFNNTGEHKSLKVYVLEIK